MNERLAKARPRIKIPASKEIMLGTQDIPNNRVLTLNLPGLHELVSELKKDPTPVSTSDIPNLKKINKAEKKNSSGWTPENIEDHLNDGSGLIDKERLTRQSNTRFDPKEITKGIKTLLGVNRLTGKKLTVYAGYTGQFSQALKKAGFDVLHTDATLAYANLIGFENKTAYFHNVTHRPGTLAAISFEGTPPILTEGGHVGFLNTLANTSHGLMLVEERDPYIQAEELTGSVWKLALGVLASAYGCKYELTTTKNFLIQRVYADAEALKKITFDLELIKKLNDPERKNIDLQNPEHLSALANTLGTNPKQIEEALKRIAATAKAKETILRLHEQSKRIPHHPEDEKLFEKYGLHENYDEQIAYLSESIAKKQIKKIETALQATRKVLAAFTGYSLGRPTYAGYRHEQYEFYRIPKKQLQEITHGGFNVLKDGEPVALVHVKGARPLFLDRPPEIHVLEGHKEVGRAIAKALKKSLKETSVPIVKQKNIPSSWKHYSTARIKEG